MRPSLYSAPCAALLSILHPVQASNFDTRVPMHEKAAETFYVAAYIQGFGDTQLMVDTGSGYLTINEQTLDALKKQGTARYVRKLRGVLADGTEIDVPVYTIKALSIGGSCALRNIEAAVFPGTSRQILGLSALRQVAPFIFSADPPTLTLSHCSPSPGATASRPPSGDALTAAD